MGYRVRAIPDNPKDLQLYLQTELENIAIAIANVELDVVSFKVWYEVPPKAREGDMYYGALDVGVTGAAGWRVLDDTGTRLMDVT